MRERQRSVLSFIRELAPLEACDAPLAMMVVSLDRNGVVSTKTQGFDTDSIFMVADEMHAQVHSIIALAKDKMSAAG